MSPKASLRWALNALAAGAVGLGVGCHPAGGAVSSAPSSAAAAASAQSAAPVGAGPPAAGLAFQVVVSLSPAAAAKIAATGDSITVPAEFYGDPIDQRLRDQVQGRLDLAPEEDVQLTGAGTANFAAPAVDQAKLAAIRGGQVEVAIDVSSGNHVTENNLLDCDSFMDQTLQAAAAQPIQIHCKLIGES